MRGMCVSISLLDLLALQSALQFQPPHLEWNYFIGSELSKMTVILITTLILLVVSVGARIGYDLSVPADAQTWTCLRDAIALGDGPAFAIVRVFRNIGEIDTNAATTLRSATDAGMGDLGAYIFPCIAQAPYSLANNNTCGSAEDQVVKSLQYLESNRVFVKGYNDDKGTRGKDTILNRIWLDIEDEQPSKYFSENISDNTDFLKKMVSKLEGLGVTVGIYTTKTYWENIMGNVKGYGSHALWYPRYDGENTYDFFEPFADFTITSLMIKQTGGNVEICGLSQVDSDFSEYMGAI